MGVNVSDGSRVRSIARAVLVHDHEGVYLVQKRVFK